MECDHGFIMLLTLVCCPPKFVTEALHVSMTTTVFLYSTSGLAHILPPGAAEVELDVNAPPCATCLAAAAAFARLWPRARLTLAFPPTRLAT